MDPIILPRISDQKPLVSVVSTTYNHEPYIRDCLEGFLMQKTNFPVEVIIHDDASTDHTADIIREYYEKRPDLFHVIIERENQYSQHINISIPLYEQAQGKYIALCEGDDYWTDPLKLQKQFDFMESHPDCSLCFHNVLQKTEGINDSNRLTIPQGETTPKMIYPHWAIPTCSVLLKKQVIPEYIKTRLRFKGFYCGDIVLFLSASNIGKLWGLKDTMAVYRRLSSGATNRIQNQSILKQLRHHKAIRKAWPKLENESRMISTYWIYFCIIKRKGQRTKKRFKLLISQKLKYHLGAYFFFANSLYKKATNKIRKRI